MKKKGLVLRNVNRLLDFWKVSSHFSKYKTKKKALLDHVIKDHGSNFTSS